MQNFEENLASRVNGSLQPLLGVSVTVKTAMGLLATIYSDNGATTQGNPMTTDANGRFGFYAANGDYVLTFSGPQIQTYERPIDLYDPDDAQPLTQAQAALPSAASRIGYQLSGTGSVARTTENKLNENVSALDFVAAQPGGDITAGLQAAIDAVAATGRPGAVTVPDGTWLCGPIVLKPGVDVVGKSVNSAFLIPNADAITMFSMVFASSSGANVKIGGFSIYCAAHTGIKGMQFTHCNRVALESMNFYGCLTNFEFDRGGLHRVRNVVSAGTPTNKSGSMKMWSSVDTAFGSVFSIIDNYRIENNGMGVQSPAVYFRRAVGVRVSRLVTNDSNYTGTCILIENDCQGITIENSLVVGYSIGCVFQKGGGINKAPIVNTLSNVDFDQCLTNAILITAGVGNEVNGGKITSSAVGTTSKAIALIGADASENTLRGVHIGGYYDTNGTGVLLSNTSKNRLYDVQVEGCAQGLAFDGTNTQTHVRGGDLSSNVPIAIGGSIAGVGNRVEGVKGFFGTDRIGSPAMPASGVTVTNNYGCAARVFINGGTISLISINSIASGFTTGAMLMLLPGESLSITYSVAPSWNWIGSN